MKHVELLALTRVKNRKYVQKMQLRHRFLTEKCSLPIRFHHKRCQKAVQHSGSAITIAVTYKFLSKATTKYATVFENIMQ